MIRWHSPEIEERIATDDRVSIEIYPSCVAEVKESGYYEIEEKHKIVTTEILIKDIKSVSEVKLNTYKDYKYVKKEVGHFFGKTTVGYNEVTDVTKKYYFTIGTDRGFCTYYYMSENEQEVVNEREVLLERWYKLAGNLGGTNNNETIKSKKA